MSEARNSAEVHVFEASTPVYPQPLFPDDRYSQGTPHGWRPTRSGIYTRHMITVETVRTHRHSRPTIVDDPDILVIRAAIVSVCTVTAMLRRGKFGGASTSHVYTHSTTSPHNLWFSLGTVPYFSTESRHGRRTPASRRGPVSRPSMFGLIRQYTIDERSCRAPR